MPAPPLSLYRPPSGRLTWAALAAGLFLGACATTDDPRQGGLAGGMHGLSSGAYDRRLEERQDSLQRLDEIQRELDRDQAQLNSQRDSKQARLDELNASLGQLDQETALLSKRLREQSGQLGSQKAKAAQLEKDLNRLRTDIALVEGQANAGKPVAELEAERDSLEDEYRTLLDLYLELGQ